MARVLIADDHAMFRQGLRAVLEANGASVVGEAADGDEALEHARKDAPDVILLDVSMPGTGGLKAIEELRKLERKVGILILTAHPENRYAVRCLKAGADGYMTKERAADELMKAIEKVHAGGKYISPSLAEALASFLDSDVDRLHDRLSAREYQAMMMIAEGKTVSQIAAELELSVKTVSTYRTRILQKLKLANNAQIMHYAVREGLIEIADER